MEINLDSPERRKNERRYSLECPRSQSRPSLRTNIDSVTFPSIEAAIVANVQLREFFQFFWVLFL